jgi:hypothetical protein
VLREPDTKLPGPVTDAYVAVGMIPRALPGLWLPSFLAATGVTLVAYAAVTARATAVSRDLS